MSVTLEKKKVLCNQKNPLYPLLLYADKTNSSRNPPYKENTKQDLTYIFLSKQNGSKVPLLKKEKLTSVASGRSILYIVNLIGIYII